MASNPTSSNPTDETASFIESTIKALLSELSSPTNLILTLICLYLIYKIFFNHSETSKISFFYILQLVLILFSLSSIYWSS